jgi:hypothetical protein
VLACLAMTACQTSAPGHDDAVVEVQPTLPPGYPPKIGSVAAELNGKAQHWDVYDYSIGARDAASQIMQYGGPIEFMVMGQPAGAPDVRRNRLAIKATMPAKLATGPLADALIEVVAGEDWDGLRLSSSGQKVELVLDRLADANQSSYGHVSGHFNAVLCSAKGQPIQVDNTHCQTFTGTFDTDLQFNNL